MNTDATSAALDEAAIRRIEIIHTTALPADYAAVWLAHAKTYGVDAIIAAALRRDCCADRFDPTVGLAAALLIHGRAWVLTVRYPGTADSHCLKVRPATMHEIRFFGGSR